MLACEYTLDTTVSSGNIWKTYRDVQDWSAWDCEVKYSYLEGTFRSGTTGILKPTKGPKVNFTLVKVDPGYEFITMTRLPFAKMFFRHRIESTESGSQLTHQLTFTGLLASVFYRLIGKSMYQHMPTVMSKLVQRAKRQDSAI